MSGILRNKLGFESLESKQMLAGDVLVSLINGNLLIGGDAEANSLVITAGEEEGTLVIQGLDGTKVQFADADPTAPPTPETGLVVEDVRGHVRISLGDGDDMLAIHDIELPRSLATDMGAGEDKVRIGAAEDIEGEVSEDAEANVKVGGWLSVRTGEDNDSVVVGNASVGAVLSVLTDGGDDAVTLGAEGDVLESGAANEGEAATLRARYGVSVALGDGADTATLQEVATRGGVAIGGGNGGDVVNLANVRALALGIRGGGDVGADNVDLSGLHVGHAAIELGAGADELSIVDSAFKSLAVGMGAGDDSLSISMVTARRALLAGGEGAGDELVEAGDNTIRRLAISGFEVPADVNTEPVLPRNVRPRLPGSIAGLLGRLRR
jgi:hypothetical protein